MIVVIFHPALTKNYTKSGADTLGSPTIYQDMGDPLIFHLAPPTDLHSGTQ